MYVHKTHRRQAQWERGCFNAGRLVGLVSLAAAGAVIPVRKNNIAHLTQLTTTHKIDFAALLLPSQYVVKFR